MNGALLPVVFLAASGCILAGVGILVLRKLMQTRRTEFELREAGEQLRMAMQASGIIGFEWNIATGVTRRTGGPYIDPWLKDDHTYNEELSWIHPEDRTAARQRLDAALRGDAELYISEHRQQVPSGTPWRWVRVYGRITRDAHGQPIRMMGLAMDITASRCAELAVQENFKALQASEERFRRLGEVLPLIVSLGDKDGKVVYVNPFWEEFSGRTAEDFINGDWRDAVQPDDNKRVSAAWKTAIAAGQSYEYEFRARAANGEFRWLLARSVPVHDADGQVAWWVNCAIDIHARKQAETLLHEAERRKDEFVATLAHELRNPLAPIRNAARLLESHESSDPQLAWTRKVIDRQVRIMARLLDDLLDINRITRGRLELRRERVELAVVIDTAVETSRPLIDERCHALDIILPQEAVELDADPVRLAQIFSNLLNNAARYTEPGGQIRVTAQMQDDQVAISVRDNGAGISPDALPHVFEIFSQVTPALAQSQGGLGLGLSLARGLVELHGGRIEARSAGVGQGCEIRIHLPIAPRTTAAPSQPSGTAPAPGLKRRILVVDDLKDSADSLAALLTISGHEVHTAYDGEQAIEAAGRLRPDVILLDIRMPKLNGYQACRGIRQQEWGRRIQLIALTGWGQEEDRRRTREAGFDYHLVKPVDPDALEILLATTAKEAIQAFTSSR